MPVRVRLAIEAVENLAGTHVEATYAGPYHKTLRVSVRGSAGAARALLREAGFVRNVKGGGWVLGGERTACPRGLALEFLEYVRAAPPSVAVEAVYRTVDRWLEALKFPVPNELLALAEPEGMPWELAYVLAEACAPARAHLSSYGRYYRRLEKALPRHPGVPSSALAGLEPWVRG